MELPILRNAELYGQRAEGDLDVAFAALADGTWRGALRQLGGAESSTAELATTFELTPTGLKKHVDVLKRAGLRAAEKVGRVGYCRTGVPRLHGSPLGFTRITHDGKSGSMLWTRSLKN